MIAFTPATTVALGAGTTTGNVALGKGKVVRIFNAGPALAFVKFGGASVTATVNDMPVINGGTVLGAGIMAEYFVRDESSQTHIAGITASSAASLVITTGDAIL